VKPRIFDRACTSLYNEELEVVLKCMGATYSICCRDHTNIAHISAGMDIWTYVDWEYLLI
jgi:hypothetical protein